MKKVVKHPLRINSRTKDEAKQSGLKRATVAQNIQYDTATEKYIVQFYYGKIDGKAHREHKTYQTLNEAKEALIKFNAEKIGGLTPQITKKMTVGECVNEFIKRSRAQGRIERTTENGYTVVCNRLKKHILYNKKISSLKRRDIETYIAEVRATTDLKPATINKDIDLIHRSMQYAAESGYISSNPIHNIPKLKEERFEETPYNIDEFNALREALDKSEDYPLVVSVYLGMYMGMRRGEIIGLRWDRISFPDNSIKINETRTQTGKEIVDKQPKNLSSNRKIEMNERVREILIKYREYQLENNILGDYVVVTPSGKRENPTYISKRFNLFLSNNGLRHIRFHDLRHSFATICINNNVSINAIAGMLGHSSTATTYKYYIHTDVDSSKIVNSIMKDVF